MTRSRTVLLGALLLGALAVPAAVAQAAPSPHALGCSDSWKAPVSGVWGLGSNWSTGQIPAGNDDVCITLPGTYTVTLAPWSIGTADPNSNAGNVNSITIGSPSGPGTQSLDVVGQGSTSNSNEQVSTVSLSVAATSTITASGELVLDSTDGGSTLPVNPSGGYAAVLGAEFVNYGTIEAYTQAPSNNLANFTDLAAAVVNEPHASMDVVSGQLREDAVTNDGSFKVFPGASMSLVPLQGAYGAPASFTDHGALTNDGSIVADQSVGTVTWTQDGAAVKGNEIVLGGGAVLVDKAGAAQFYVSSIGAKLTGTVPSGQKITVVGGAYNSGGNNYNGTTLDLDSSTVTNDGTIVLEAPGSGTKSGGPAIVSQGGVRNNGSILAEIKDPSWSVEFQGGLENEHKATLVVTGGTFSDSAGPATNEGTVTVGPKALYLLEAGAVFSNKANGTIVPEVASPTRLGQFQVVAPCCAGPGKFVAGGSLSPYLAAHVAANTDFQLFLLSGGIFKGTFSHLAKHFTADYSHETASPAYVGAIYDKSGKKPKS